MSEWQFCCKTTEVSEGKPIGKEIDGVPVGVFKVADEWYALKDVCPHQYALLSEGYRDGDAVECPLHQACFEIATGKCLSGPSEQDVETLAIKIEGDEILVRLPPPTERTTPG